MTARPTLTTPAVANAIARHISKSLLDRNPNQHGVEADERLSNVVLLAMTAEADAFSRARHVHASEFGHLADAQLVYLFDDEVSHEGIRSFHEREWVLATGTRFKAPTGCIVEFSTSTGTREQGEVKGIVSNRAVGLVAVTKRNLTKTWITNVIVPAENFIRIVSAAAPKPVMPKTYA